MATPKQRRRSNRGKRVFSPGNPTTTTTPTPASRQQTKRGNLSRTPLVSLNDALRNSRQENVAGEESSTKKRSVTFQERLQVVAQDDGPRRTHEAQPRSQYLAYQKAMKTPFLALNPGMTFGQRSKYTALRYAEDATSCENDDEPILDPILLNYDSHQSNPPSVKFDDIKQIIVLALKQDVLIQKQWWLLEHIVNAINRLNELSKTCALHWQSKVSSKQLLVRLRKCQSFVAQSEKEFASSTKKIFLRCMKVGNKNCSAIYIDLSHETKTIDYDILHPKHWFDELSRKRLSIKTLVPLSIYMLINPWYSTELEIFFGAREGETALEAARSLFDALTEAQKTVSGAKKHTEGLQTGSRTYYLDGLGTEDGLLELEMDPIKVEKLATRNKEMATYMRKALSIALDLDAENEQFSFKQCCDIAVTDIQACLDDGRLNADTGGRTVLDWFRDFKKKRLFLNPLLQEQHGIPFFLNNPSSVRRIRDFGNNNLSRLTISLVQDFILNEEIPRLLDEYKQANEGRRQKTKEQLLYESGIKVLCLSTVHKWMRYLGFKRGIYKKSFYTDNHERPDVVAHRIEYCIKFCELEIRSYVWVQLLPDRVAQLKASGRIMPMNDGYRVAKGGVDLVEYHVDDVKDAYQLDELTSCTRFGANLSLRKSPADCPVIMWGQDEVVSHEKQQSAMTWFGSEGQAPPRPKDKGIGYHISGIKCREVGWMPVPTQAELDEINSNRAGKRYVAEEAAVAVLGSAEKQPFTMETFELYTFRWGLHIGANNGGYWTNQHALIQYENCADAKKVMYPHVLHVDYYDHSQGHMAKRSNGLDVSKINKSFGGNQPSMRTTSIADGTCVGKFAGKGLHVGDPFHCVFQEGDDGPIALEPQRRQELKHDKVFHGETTKKTLRSKEEIYKHLKQNLPRSMLCKLPAEGQLGSVSYASLKEIATKSNIDLSIQVPKKQIGWVGQPKGAFQICYERGLIDETLGYSYYTMDGRKDEAGNIIPGSSLRQLLEGCSDFKEEMTMLEWVASEYDCKVLFSPKCHPEIAGVGIEYDWGHAKNTLNRIALGERRGVAKFIDVILNRCFSRDNLSKAIMRANARQARTYIVAYLMMHAAVAASVDSDANEFATGSISLEALKKSVTHIASSNIKAAKKTYKRHRGIALFDVKGGVDFVMPKREFDCVKRDAEQEEPAESPRNKP